MTIVRTQKVQKLSELEIALLAAIHDAGLPLPDLEHKFHPVRRWRFDMAWIARGVACEVEGGTFIQGRHSRGVGMDGDMQKYSEAAIDGWLVVRVSARMIRNGDATEYIRRALLARPFLES